MFIAGEGREGISYVVRGDLSLKWCSANLKRTTKPKAGLGLWGKKQQPIFYCGAKIGVCHGLVCYNKLALLSVYLKQYVP